MLQPDLSGGLKDRLVQVKGGQDCPGFVKIPQGVQEDAMSLAGLMLSQVPTAPGGG